MSSFDNQIIRAVAFDDVTSWKGGDIRRLQYVLGHWNVYDTKKMYGAVVTEKFKSTAVSPFEIGSLVEK